MGSMYGERRRASITQMAHSCLASPQATIAVLSAHGLYTKKSLGQHFLVDDNVIGRIMALAGIGADDVVLEVGPGIGTLTVALCSVSPRVVAVERDTALLPALAQTTADCPTVPAIVNADAAKIDVAQIAEPFGPPTLLVANLPYGVAATVTLRCFETMPTLRAATVMVQAEVAERMAAAPGCKDYGAYTVKLGLRARVAGRFAVARTSFLPPPRVDSAVIRLERVDRGLSEPMLEAVVVTVNAAFSQRRKTLRNTLRAGLSAPVEPLDAALAAAGIDGGVRAETLSVENFILLTEALRQAELLG